MIFLKNQSLAPPIQLLSLRQSSLKIIKNKRLLINQMQHVELTKLLTGPYLVVSLLLIGGFPFLLLGSEVVRG